MLSLVHKCVFYRPGRNEKRGHPGTEFRRSSNAKLKYTNFLSSKSKWEKWCHLSSCQVYSRSWKCQKWLFFAFSADGNKKSVTVLANNWSTSERSYAALTVNAMLPLVKYQHLEIQVLDISFADSATIFIFLPSISHGRQLQSLLTMPFSERTH